MQWHIYQRTDRDEIEIGQVDDQGVVSGPGARLIESMLKHYTDMGLSVADALARIRFTSSLIGVLPADDEDGPVEEEA